LEGILFQSYRELNDPLTSFYGTSDRRVSANATCFAIRHLKTVIFDENANLQRQYVTQNSAHVYFFVSFWNVAFEVSLDER